MKDDPNKMIQFPSKKSANYNSASSSISENVDELTKSKIKCFEEWMANDHALVHLDSRCKSVIVPISLKDNPALTLKLSYLFNGKTTFNEKEISSFLKFSGNYFECIIPWDKVWGMSSDTGEQKIWPENLPKENDMHTIAEETKVEPKKTTPTLTRLK